MKVFTFTIDLKKIPEDKIVKTDKEGKPFKNGGEFVRLTLFHNDKEDNYGNDLKVIISQSKEEQENNISRIFVGDGKTKKTK